MAYIYNQNPLKKYIYNNKFITMSSYYNSYINKWKNKTTRWLSLSLKLFIELLIRDSLFSLLCKWWYVFHYYWFSLSGIVVVFKNVDDCNGRWFDSTCVADINATGESVTILLNTLYHRHWWFSLGKWPGGVVHIRLIS